MFKLMEIIKRGKIIFIISIFLLTNCNKDLNTEIGHKRMVSVFNSFKEGIDSICDKLEKEKIIIKFPDVVSFPVMGIIKNKEMAIDLAKVYFQQGGKYSVDQYLPFYAMKYRNIWFVYGCNDISSAKKPTWENIGKWYELILIIDSDTGQVEYIQGLPPPGI